MSIRSRVIHCLMVLPKKVKSKKSLMVKNSLI